MIQDWREFKVGMHVRLKCGCEGFIERVSIEPDESDRGFLMVYTMGQCGFRRSHEQEYGRGYGPYRNMFNYNLCDEAMPAGEVPPPAWFPSLEAGPLRNMEAGR